MDEGVLLDELEPMLRRVAAAEYMRHAHVSLSVDFEDYFQDARMIALDAARRYDPRRTSADLKTFIGGTVKRRLVDRSREYAGAGLGRSRRALTRSIDAVRRSGTFDDAGEPEALQITDGLSAEDQAQVNIDAALARLPRRQRQALRCRMAGMTPAETARSLRTKQLRPAELTRARAQLRAEIL